MAPIGIMTLTPSSFLHMPQFIVTWAVFFGSGCLIYLIYILKNRRAIPFYECIGFKNFRQKMFRKSLYMDVTMYAVGKFTDFVIMAPFIAANVFACGLIISFSDAFFPFRQAASFNYACAAGCTIVMFLAAELSEYIFHISEHKFPFLWEFHKVHHSAHHLNPLTAKRNHPVSLLIGGSARGFLTGLAAGVLVSVFAISTAEALALSLVASKIFIIATLDPLKHSHFPISLGFFDRVLISPHMHQIHHSKKRIHWDKNFGTNVSIFDWLFGTGYKPVRGEQPVYGISGLSDEKLQTYNTLYGAYLYPLVKSLNIARQGTKTLVRKVLKGGTSGKSRTINLQ